MELHGDTPEVTDLPQCVLRVARDDDVFDRHRDAFAPHISNTAYLVHGLTSSGESYRSSSISCATFAAWTVCTPPRSRAHAAGSVRPGSGRAAVMSRTWRPRSTCKSGTCQRAERKRFLHECYSPATYSPVTILWPRRVRNAPLPPTCQVSCWGLARSH
jgi:hypothetical protein